MKKFDRIRAGTVLESRAKGQTLQQIGDRMGLSKERIRQIESKANELLQEDERRKEFIKTFLEEISYIKSRYPLPIEDGNKDEVYGRIDQILYNTRTWELELSVRTCTALKHSNLRTVGELVQKTSKQLLEIRNFGRKSLIELEGELAKFGLRLGMKLKWGEH